MQPVSEPEIIAFLHHVAVHHPELRGLAGLPPEYVAELVVEFSKSAGRSIDLRKWNFFISAPEWGGSRNSSMGQWWPNIFGARKARRHELHDPLARYLAVPTKALFFYTSEDTEISNYLERYWNDLHEQTGNFLDIYDFAIHYTRQYQTFAKRYIEALFPIPGATISNIMDVGLPCVLLWSMNAWVVLPLADVAGNLTALRGRLRDIFAITRGPEPLSEWHVSDLVNLEIGYGIAVNTPSASNDLPDPCDVFISYKRSDSNLMERVRSLLATHGIVCWVDQLLSCGERFRQRIRAQIEAAAATITLFTTASVRSPWVLAESRYAMAMDKLLPLSFDQAVIPQPFNDLNVLQLVSNLVSPDDPSVLELVRNVRSRMKPRERLEPVRAVALTDPGITRPHLPPGQLLEPVIAESAEKLAQPLAHGEIARQIRRLKHFRLLAREELRPTIDTLIGMFHERNLLIPKTDI